MNIWVNAFPGRCRADFFYKSRHLNEILGDFIQASREIVFYTWLKDGSDPLTGESVKAGDIVTSWLNPLTGEIVPAYPITNEFLPVNRSGLTKFSKYGLIVITLIHLHRVSI